MPNRLIKESICTSDTVNDLSWFQEVFFYRLITVCDDYGRMDARPQILKGRMFPLKEDLRSGEVQKALNALDAAGLIRLYQVRRKPFLQVLTWDQHQQIRAKVPKYPGMDEVDGDMIADDIRRYQMISDDSKCPRNPIQSESESNPNPEGRAREAASYFERFWAEYPKKVGKGAAEKAFGRCRVTAALLDAMLSAVRKARQSAQWQAENGRFIPNPATWLNQRRWEDDSSSLMTAGKTVSAQNYAQRDYDEKDLEERLGVNDLFKEE